MTYIVPVTAAAAGYGTMAAMGHPTAAIFVGGGCALLGLVGRYAGHGIHLTRGQMRKVEHLMHRTLAANWGIRPLTQQFDEAEQQKLIGSMFDAVAGEPIQNLVEQWPVIWAHVQRVHFSGIPPLASLKAMKRAYRPGLFGKDKGKARELAAPVVQAYAMLHPNPESARDWYMRWAGTVGLPDTLAHQMWADALNAPRPVRQEPIPEDIEDEEVIRQTVSRARAPRPTRPPATHLSDAEIERRMAASRA